MNMYTPVSEIQSFSKKNTVFFMPPPSEWVVDKVKYRAVWKKRILPTKK